MKRDVQIAARVQKTADITGVSIRTVQRVIIGDQNNEEVLSTYMELEEMDNVVVETIKKSRLIQAVEQAVPFN